MGEGKEDEGGGRDGDEREGGGLGTIKARPRSAVRASNHAQYAVNRKYGVA